MVQMKEQIIEAAQSQLQRGGYDTLNFGDIAKELGITRANIHYHFNDKKSLAMAATERYVEQTEQLTNSLTEQYQDDIIAFADALETMMRGHYAKEGAVEMSI